MPEGRFIDRRFEDRIRDESLRSFFSSGIKASAIPIERYGVDPAKFNAEPRDFRNDLAIAHQLSKVKVIGYSPATESNLPADEVLLEKIKLTVAKAGSAKEKSNILRVKKILIDFVDRFIDKSVDVMTEIGGSKVTRLMAEVSLIATAASSPLEVVAPLSGTQVGEKVVATQTVPAIIPGLKPLSPPSSIATELHAATPESPPYLFDPESQKIVDELKADFGLSLMMPSEFEGLPTLPWTPAEIGLVDKGIRSLPPDYTKGPKTPKEIVLVRSKGTNKEGAGGNGGGNGIIILRISETFNPDAMFNFPPYRAIYGTNGEQLEMTILHEWTHIYTLQMNSEVMGQWISMMGWYLKGKDVNGKEIWVNDHSQELKQLAYGKGSPDNPYEDIAVSIEQFAADPQSLPKDRFTFFLICPAYQNWAVVSGYSR